MDLKGETISQLPMQAHVEVVLPDTSVSDVVKLMCEKNIAAVIVFDNEKIEGIFTERDCLKKISNIENVDSNKPIKDFMTPNPKTLKNTDSILRAVLLMRMGRFRHVVIVDENNKLTSVLSIKDVMDYLCDKVG